MRTGGHRPPAGARDQVLKLRMLELPGKNRAPGLAGPI